MTEYLIERIAHIQVVNRDHNVYISVCYDTMQLHGFKYDHFSCEYEIFTIIHEFEEWIQSPLRRLGCV
jgi:hypothetical protein